MKEIYETSEIEIINISAEEAFAITTSSDPCPIYDCPQDVCNTDTCPTFTCPDHVGGTEPGQGVVEI